MNFSYFYSPSLNNALPAYSVGQLMGQDPNTMDLAVLNIRGWYPVNLVTPQYDANLYVATPSYVISGSYADQQWTFTPVALSAAVAVGSTELKRKASAKVDGIVSASGFSSNLYATLSSVTGTIYQGTVTSINDVSVQLNSDINVYLPATTTVDEVNDVVKPPTGLINIGRGATGAEDLNATTYTSFTSYTLPESGTELFVTGTGTVISYSGSGFPATAGAFNPGDYEIEIRQVSTGRIIARFDVPLNASNEDVAF
jgi:hypothetical protein